MSGPGGVGKGTLVARLLERNPHMSLSRSWTTRARRPGESPDAYHFVDREVFERHIADGGFLEWVEFLDYLQGSPLPGGVEGDDVLFEIDVKGARSVLAAYPDALSIFVDAPSRDEQRRRLIERGDTADHVTRRLDHASTEVAAARELGSVFIVNDDLDDAVAAVESAIAEHRMRGNGSKC